MEVAPSQQEGGIGLGKMQVCGFGFICVCFGLKLDMRLDIFDWLLGPFVCVCGLIILTVCGLIGCNLCLGVFFDRFDCICLVKIV